MCFIINNFHRDVILRSVRYLISIWGTLITKILEEFHWKDLLCEALILGSSFCTLVRK